MKKIFIIIISIILISIPIIFYFYQDSKILQYSCTLTGGEWTTFNSGCADQCYLNFEKSDGPFDNTNYHACTMALTESCDCGKDRCWSNIFCKDVK